MGRLRSAWAIAPVKKKNKKKLFLIKVLFIYYLLIKISEAYQRNEIDKEYQIYFLEGTRLRGRLRSRFSD